ncbi:MAG: M20/M25/M40 family metallo-hydrolase [Bacteroidales bacterium]|nr:M20/M25/M40 family metallo-hydrolase [Bacteroidales bacterium]
MSEWTGLLESLIAIPSLSREEGPAVDFLQKWMSARGHVVRRTGNNLWCESEPPCGKPTVLLNAHIDTVKPSSGYTRDPFSPTREGDRIYGLGSNDDGGSLVSLLAAYEILSGKEQPYRLIYSVTAQEEVSGREGIELIFPETGPVAFGIIGEPTRMEMAISEKGLMVLDCTAFGKSGHAAREEGVNAIYAAMEDIDWFRHFNGRVSPLLGPVRMSVTVIGAGDQHNVVPDRCRFVVDVRPNGLYTNEELLGLIRANVRSEVVPRSTRLQGTTISEDHPAVIRGKRLGLKSFGSPTLSNRALCPFPCIKIGPGDSARSHTADEYICVSELEDAVGIYVKLLDGLEI